MNFEYWNRRKRNDDENYPIKEFNSNTDDSQFQRDRARIIHSAAFRRLQTKTQVLGLGENDFYRTRLTHSLEVAQIGSAICERLHDKYNDNDNDNIKKWIPSLSLIEAIGLSHDIGHPPFGHGGEVALNYSMRESGGFEGNGQTLRIVSRLAEYSPNNGMDLTRRTLLGLVKYPVSYSRVKNYIKKEDVTGTPLNLDNWHPPKCYLDDEEEILKWIFKSIPLNDYKTFTEIKCEENKHHKTKFKSFDTTIMELADDISYGVHDLEDGIALGLITREMWETDVVKKIEKYKSDKFSELSFYGENLFKDSNKNRKHAISKLVGFFISAVSISTNDKFETPLLELKAELDPISKEILTVLKDLVMFRVIKTPEVQVLEYKGQQIILKIFEVLKENPHRLLPQKTFQLYSNSENKNRVLCDYISGMTDNYATKLYHKLFSPNIGSIFDRL